MGGLVSIFTIGINSKSFPWIVRSAPYKKTPLNFLRRPMPIHELHNTPCHNVDGLRGRGLKTSEYGQNGDKPKRRQQ